MQIDSPFSTLQEQPHKPCITLNLAFPSKQASMQTWDEDANPSHFIPSVLCSSKPAGNFETIRKSFIKSYKEDDPKICSSFCLLIETAAFS
jgi:hypothetical protein